MSRTRRLLLAGGAVCLLLLGYGIHYLSGMVSVGIGYSAKTMCSGVFVSGRDQISILNEDLAHGHPLEKWMELEVDPDRRIVTASVAGLIRRQAQFREGLGCTRPPATS